ncbi:MAG: IS481 family transposase, partial [Deltaproteobacteria bacterium]
PGRKVFAEQEQWILELRHSGKMGAGGIQNALYRHYGFRLSLATIHKVFTRNKVTTPLRRKRKCLRYSRPIPGERVRMDTCKIGPGLYQYTAIDDCSRFKVVELYSRRTAKNTLHFIDRVIEEMPFPIQRFQTDRGKEFFAYRVQERLVEYGIKFRPIKPRFPHPNGKVERTQKTDLEESYANVDLRDPELKDKLRQWQFYFNWHRRPWRPIREGPRLIKSVSWMKEHPFGKMWKRCMLRKRNVYNLKTTGQI